MSRRLPVALLAALAFPPAASAQPGDPLPQPVAPVGGAAVTADANGVVLTFTCPAYRSSPADDAPSDDLGGYAARLARDPAGTDDFASAGVQRSASDPSQCTARVTDSSYENPAHTTPGTYYWFVDRTCFCPNGADTERGPVASFRLVTGAARLTAAVQRKAFAGYAIRVRLTTDLADGTEVQLQRKVGANYEGVTGPSPVRVADGRAELPVTLSRGRQKLRWAVIRGRQTDVGAPATVTVVKPSGWRTSRRDDGPYRSAAKASLSFKVVKRGRELRDFSAQVPTYCIGGPDVSDNRIVISYALVKRIKVAPDGRFLTIAEVSRTTAIVSGRLRDGKVSGGKVQLSYPLCSGARDFTASRR